MKAKPLILAAVLLVIGLRLLMVERQGHAQPAKGMAKPMATHLKHSRQIFGIGRTKDEAVRMALSKAAAEVRTYLRSQSPPFEWEPSTDYVATHLLSKSGPVQDEDWQPPGLEPIDAKETWQKWDLKVEISDADFEDMSRHNQKQVLAHRQSDRLLLVGKASLFLLAAALVCLGYLRLEERTKGYFSRWLIIGVVGLLGILGIGLLIMG